MVSNFNDFSDSWVLGIGTRITRIYAKNAKEGATHFVSFALFREFRVPVFFARGRPTPESPAWRKGYDFSPLSSAATGA